MEAARKIKAKTLKGKKDKIDGSVDYVPCPKTLEKRDIKLCKGCEYWIAYGSERKRVISPSRREVFESVPTVDCSYVSIMPEGELEEYEKFCRVFYGIQSGLPKRDEADEILESLFSHLHPHYRNELE